MEENDSIIAELKKIRTMLAMALVKDLDSNTAKILMLNKCGLGSSEIADMLGTTRGTVSVAISQSKKKQSTVKPKPKRGQSKRDDQSEA